MRNGDQFDVVVIGGGPGGYVAAIKAAQLGMKVACVEQRGSLGGTCLNVGCIPSKALLHSSHEYAKAKDGLLEHGVVVGKVSLALDKLMARKDKVVNELCRGIEGLFKKNKVEYVIGKGQIIAKDRVKVTAKGQGERTLSARNIIIATGSEVAQIPGVTIDEKRIVSSTGALSLQEVPKKMVVIGGGYIGLELGQVWSNLGAEVTVVEFADRLVPAMDQDICNEVKKLLEQDGIKFKLSTKLLSAKANSKDVKIEVEDIVSGKKEAMTADVMLVCVGRRPYTSDLGLESVGVKLDERGRIPVGANFATSASNIYAIGDVAPGPMLAHKAEEEGVAVAEIIAGQHPHVNYDTIPGVVYTHPEVASVGKTEQELKSAGIEYRVGKFPFLANSRAKATGQATGFVKLLVNASTDQLLGAHIIGPHAGELIAELVLAMEYKASAEDIARTCHAHPGFSEAVKEAALAAYFKPIHM
ncbi:MAG: dihydrolipoyl dehydrogenase [Proteobacteria bacterium]|nr:dihydrolipoyl dehydrogenase [Pseudomonadota bacterium]